MEKTAVVNQSVFSNEWINPGGGTTYYFDVRMSNGDSGSIGVNDKNSDKVRVGSEITYTIYNGKIKVINNQKNNMDNSKGYNKSNYKKQGKEQYLGYAWSYAKDLIIAGKTMEDVEELNKVARYIYEQIDDMLNNK